jgi:hypothetical protein
MFLFNKIREQEGGTGSTQEVGCGVGGPQIMYTHVSKCKNGKVKIKKGKKKDKWSNRISFFLKASLPYQSSH